MNNKDIWKVNPSVQKKEFENPDLMHPDLILGLMETRFWLKTPMYFSINGPYPRHHNGDAVDADAESHAGYSLHKAGINHSLSKQTNRLIKDQTKLGMAQDWDAGKLTMDQMFDTYLKLERLNIWSGIGLYPNWVWTGFHTDLREIDHPDNRYRWFRRDRQDTDGAMSKKYYELTWSNWKKYVIEEAE